MNYRNSRLHQWCSKCQFNDLLHSNCTCSDEEGKNSATGMSQYNVKKGLNLHLTGRSSTKQVLSTP